MNYLRVIPKRYYVIAVMVLAVLWLIHWAGTPQRTRKVALPTTTVASTFPGGVTTTSTIPHNETTTTLPVGTVKCGTVKLFGNSTGNLSVLSGASCQEAHQVIATYVATVNQPPGWSCDTGEIGKYYTTCTSDDGQKAIIVN